MNYEELSDYQINKLVAQKLGHKILHANDPPPWVCINDGPSILDAYLVDYCNNPNDAWPIIYDNHISIHFGVFTHLWSASEGVRMERVVYGVNPLRSAMIVFLKLTEGDN